MELSNDCKRDPYADMFNPEAKNYRERFIKNVMPINIPDDVCKLIIAVDNLMEAVAEFGNNPDVIGESIKYVQRQLDVLSPESRRAAGIDQ